MAPVEELSGVPRDGPTCLHCELPPIIDAFRHRHLKRDAQVIAEKLAQVLGEFIGSSAYRRGEVGRLDRIVESAADVALKRAQLIVETLNRQRS